MVFCIITAFPSCIAKQNLFFVPKFLPFRFFQFFTSHHLQKQCNFNVFHDFWGYMATKTKKIEKSKNITKIKFCFAIHDRKTVIMQKTITKNINTPLRKKIHNFCTIVSSLETKTMQNHWNSLQNSLIFIDFSWKITSCGQI